MSVAVLVETSARQEAFIADIERSVRSKVDLLEALQGDLVQLESEGLRLTRDCFQAGLADLTNALRDIRCLRVSGGRAAFADWLHYRVSSGALLGDILDDYCSEPPSPRSSVLAIEQTVTARDDKLIEAPDAAPSRQYIHADDDYARLAGMTRDQVKDRAEAVLTNLLASGWRP